MNSELDQYDKLILEAFASGLVDPRVAADASPPADLPPGLASRILASASTASQEILAERVRTAADAIGLSRSDLVELASGDETGARAFLDGRGSPDKVHPSTIARWFWALRLAPSRWHELLHQAIASSARFAPSGDGEVVFGRTTGLDDGSRAQALMSGRTLEDREKGRRVADQFVQEVMEDWETLSTNGATS